MSLASDHIFSYIHSVYDNWREPKGPVNDDPIIDSTLIGEAKDSNTVALWLFDETSYANAPLLDASIYEIADLSLTSGTNVPGKFGNAVTSACGYNVIYSGYAGNGAIQPRERDGIPSGLVGPTFASQKLNEAIGLKNHTLEFWLNPIDVPDQDAYVFEMGRGLSTKGFSVILKANASGFLINNHYSGHSSYFGLSSDAIRKNRFSHYLFAVDTSGNGSVYVNGKKTNHAIRSEIETAPLPEIEDPRNNFQNGRGWPKMTLGQKRENRFNLSLLEDRHAQNELSAIIDEIRISDIIRAKHDFVPSSYANAYSETAYIPGGMTGLPQLLSTEALLAYKPATHPLAFGKRKHVLIDARIFEAGHMTHLQFTPNRVSIADAEKTDIEKVDGEWRLSFLQDGDRMVAIATANYNSEKGLVYLYETNDGLHFTGKPASIVNYPMGGASFLDHSPHAVMQGAKFKMTAYVSNRAICLYTSPDGYTWRRNECGILPILSGGSAETFYDDQTGDYVTYLKRDSSFGNEETPTIHMRSSVRFSTRNPHKPWPFKRMNTPYFEDSPYPCVTGEGVTQFVLPNGKANDEQVYRTRAIKHAYAPDTYLGFPWIYHQNANDRDVAIAVSRDGYTWDVVTQPYFLHKGSNIEAISCQGLLRRGDELWQYMECGDSHGSGLRTWYRIKHRLDGLFSLKASDTEGSAITKSLHTDGNQLFMNYRCAPGGSVKIQLLDLSGNAIEGFDSAHCRVMTGDNTSEEVTWANSKISDLREKNFKIQFVLKHAQLYAFNIR
ncbi:MAG: hypothetical protein JW741_07645 [Sedimentisphaerales bacterium]|nr:hypothetical protein [Sedimentisphaerales bacterium]